MKKVIFIIAAIAVGAVIISLLGASVMTNAPISLPTLPAIDEQYADTDTSVSTTSETPAAPEPSVTDLSSEPTKPSVVKEYTIAAANYSFTPSIMNVEKGDTVKIILKNTGGFHDFVIDEFAVAAKRITDGQKDTVIFVADTAGAFEFYCSVGNHRQTGMKGMLTVTE